MVCAGLTLALFVLGIFTDNHYFSLALNNLALLANFLYRRSDFHIECPPKINLAGLFLISVYFERQVMRPLVRS